MLGFKTNEFIRGSILLQLQEMTPGTKEYEELKDKLDLYSDDPLEVEEAKQRIEEKEIRKRYEENEGLYYWWW